jgi:hypothetical protein
MWGGFPGVFLLKAQGIGECLDDYTKPARKIGNYFELSIVETMAPRMTV